MARPRQTARKCAFQAPAMYHYESEDEVERHPPPPPPRRPVNTARKSAPWSGAQYHYPSEDEEQQQHTPPLRHEQTHQQPQFLSQPPIVTRKRSRDSEHHSEDDEPDMDLPLGKRSLQSLSDVEDELTSTKAENRALRTHIAELTAIDRHRVALIEENNSIRASIADLGHINEENNSLRTQIDELHTFVRASGVLHNAPPSIRRRLDGRGNAAAATAAPVRAPKMPVVIDLT
ncbi:hypothetical protein LTR10_012924 [Elasticomyces elasticus]|nr:hypothetical protein LTR10_012924 [Elasticomyces elasticus]KAK4978654.1 hypothetical protein LTR42_001154 [Elasticomyces elasticus]